MAADPLMTAISDIAWRPLAAELSFEIGVSYISMTSSSSWMSMEVNICSSDSYCSAMLPLAVPLDGDLFLALY